jgi:hypothetical protein
MATRALATLILILVWFSAAELTASAQSKENLQADLNLLQSDLRTQKALIIREQLPLAQSEADAFWRLYNRYEMTVMALNTARIALMRDYSIALETMTTEKARLLTARGLDLDEKRRLIRKKFYWEFAKVLNGKSSARFEQLDRRLDLLMDLQIASELPLPK